MFDKNMSLLLGRSSSFHDIEIDARYPALSAEKGRKPEMNGFIWPSGLPKSKARFTTGYIRPPASS